MRPARAAASLLALWAIVVLVWSISGHRGLEGTAARATVLGGITLIGPGLALVLLLRITDRLLAAVVAIGLSIAILILASQASLYSGRWSPFGVVNFVAALTFAVSLMCLFRPGDRPSLNHGDATKP